MAARRAHNPKVVGSSPTPATNNEAEGPGNYAGAFKYDPICEADLFDENLHLTYKEVGGLGVPVIEYAGSPPPLCVGVFGEIFPWYWRSTREHPEREMEFQKWKFDIATAIRERRGEMPWRGGEYSVSIGLVLSDDGGHDRDVDNHFKPILDATETVLFQPNLERFLAPISDAIQPYRITNIWQPVRRASIWG